MTRTRLSQSFNDAIGGLIHCFKTQRNMRIHFFIAILTIIAAITLNVDRGEMMVLALTIAIVFICEMFNTAVEAIVDLVSKERNELARVAKNVAAGAVLVSALTALVVAYLVFYRKLSELAIDSLTYMENLPAHLTFASLMAVVIVVIIVKSLFRKGTFLRGGMPSGHTAIAFSIFISIALATHDPYSTAFSGLLALLVAESRIETGMHTLLEVIVGALLGMMMTLSLYGLSRMLVQS
ncbi:MAG: diacylglycerol kinase [Bacillota bacterium]|nr:diacylglycerol kinase [Bacillota bacterium]